MTEFQVGSVNIVSILQYFHIRCLSALLHQHLSTLQFPHLRGASGKNYIFSGHPSCVCFHVYFSCMPSVFVKIVKCICANLFRSPFLYLISYMYFSCMPSVLVEIKPSQVTLPSLTCSSLSRARLDPFPCRNSHHLASGQFALFLFFIS